VSLGGDWPSDEASSGSFSLFGPSQLLATPSLPIITIGTGEMGFSTCGTCESALLRLALLVAMIVEAVGAVVVDELEGVELSGLALGGGCTTAVEEEVANCGGVLRKAAGSGPSLSVVRGMVSGSVGEGCDGASETRNEKME
jgi:hypothetical protein